MGGGVGWERPAGLAALIVAQANSANRYSTVCSVGPPSSGTTNALLTGLLL